MAKIVNKKFNIDGMHCTACAINIDFSLEDLAGVKLAKTSYAKQTLEVEFDEEKINLAALIKTIKDLGYTAILKD